MCKGFVLCSQVEPIRDEGSKDGQGKKPCKVMGPGSPDLTSRSGPFMTPQSCPPCSKEVKLLKLLFSLFSWALP